MTEETHYTDTKFDFGTSFQYKIITNILIDKSFANSMLELLKPQYFSTNSMGWIYSQIESYITTYKTIPTKDALNTLIRTNAQNISHEEQVQIRNDMQAIYSYIGATDLHFVQDQSIIFCKNEELARAIYKSVDFLKNKNFDAIKSTIDNALKKGTSSDMGLIYDSYDAIEYRYSINRTNLVPTPWPIINNATDGGFGAGELVVFVAPSGVGKSWLLQTVGAHLIRLGKCIVHYTLELPDSYTALRYDRIVCGGIPDAMKLSIEEITQTIQSRVHTQTQSVIKFFPTKTATVNTIRAHLDKMIMNGLKPDAIIIDYGDLLKPTHYNDSGERFNIDEIYKELRGIAGEYECPVFTASQTNRGAINKDVIANDSIAESYGKVAIADFIMTLSSTLSDKTGDVNKRGGRVHVAKNRFGPDGQTYNCDINFSTGVIGIYDKDSIESKQLAENRLNNDSKASDMLISATNNGNSNCVVNTGDDSSPQNKLHAHRNDKIVNNNKINIGLPF